jgi:hypothetical protein
MKTNYIGLAVEFLKSDRGITLSVLFMIAAFITIMVLASQGVFSNEHFENEKKHAKCLKQESQHCE